MDYDLQYIIAIKARLRAMEDILRQWQAAEEACDEEEMDSASDARDQILNELEGWE